MRLPPWKANDTSDAPEESAPQQGENPSADRPRILIVDDEAALTKILARTLSGANDVAVANSGAQALEILRSGAIFDVVLCDYKMPGMSGMNLYLSLLKEAPATAKRFVFMTGAAPWEASESLNSKLQIPVLRKPFGMSELEALVAAKYSSSQRE